MDVFFMLLTAILLEFHKKPSRKHWITEKSTQKNLCDDCHFLAARPPSYVIFCGFFVYSDLQRKKVCSRKWCVCMREGESKGVLPLHPPPPIVLQPCLRTHPFPVRWRLLQILGYKTPAKKQIRNFMHSSHGEQHVRWLRKQKLFLVFQYSLDSRTKCSSNAFSKKNKAIGCREHLFRCLKYLLQKNYVDFDKKGS